MGGVDAEGVASIDGPPIHLSGSHCGVEIGPDGPSQMGLEDLGMMRCLAGSTVLYPADANCAAQLTVATRPPANHAWRVRMRW